LANKLQNSIDYDKIKEATFGGVILSIESIENDYFICNSKYGDKISVEGTYSSLIKNDVRRTTLNDRIISNIKFDIPSVMEVKEYFQRIIANSNDLSKIPSNSFKIDNTKLSAILNFEIIEKTKNISSNKLECLKCGAKVIKDLMRSHVAKHIYLKEIKIENEHLCGFCGKVCGYHVGLKVNTGSVVPISGCTHKFKFSLKAAENVSARNPSTNRPVKCELCLSLGKHEIRWLANMKLHYEIEHPSMELPENFEMTQEEKELLEKF
jgi:hypothetical protein